MSSERKLAGLVVVTSGKGGVGKSESAVDIAGALKVLGASPDTVLDLDYGATVTRRFGYEPKHPYAEALLDGKVGLDRARLETEEGLFVTPTTPQLSETPKGKTLPWRDRLVELKKDHLLVADTSDDINSAPVAAAILAADILLVPTLLNDATYERTFPEILGLLRAHGHKPEIMCFATMVDRRTKYSEDVEQTIAAAGISLLVRIPKGVAALEARRKQLSVVAYAKNSNVSKAYLDLGKHVFAQLHRLNGATGPRIGREMPELPVGA
jgi:cellulose biosynthesis protein BcsQ